MPEAKGLKCMFYGHFFTICWSFSSDGVQAISLLLLMPLSVWIIYFGHNALSLSVSVTVTCQSTHWEIWYIQGNLVDDSPNTLSNSL